MTSSDYEALHYALASSTDWSEPTLHRSEAAADAAVAAPDAVLPVDAIDEPDAVDAPSSVDEPSSVEEPSGGAPRHAAADAVWGPVSYGGPRRNRPSDAPPAVPAPSWAELLGEPAEASLVPQTDAAGHRATELAAPADVVDLAKPDATPAAAAAPAPSEDRENRGLLANSRTMAIASLASRVTGFLRTAAIAAALGVVGSGVADAYNLANMLPNMVYELLIGGVLSSVLIPLLVRAQEQDDDGGLSYAQRLLAVATVVLGITTVIAALSAPLLTMLLVQQGAQRDLATVWATILLPEIFFYGLGALFTAVLNARNVYGAPAWAPVLNNLIILVTVAVYLLLPGPAILTPSTITTAQILVLGIGTTLGIAMQALILLPWLRKVGFRWSWQLRAPKAADGTAQASSEHGLKHERNLIGWVIGYVAVSQIGLLVISRVALSRGGLTTFASADLLFQVPYGILGVSLLTALMPRMSRAAARGDYTGVLSDLSLGVRLSAIALVPVTAGLMVLGPALGTLIFNYGQTPEHDARNVGIVLALAAFGLLPFAVVMLQLRVFYAMHDARTPTLINIGMVAVKIVLVLIAASTMDDRHVIQALSVSTSASYVVGAVIGHVLLTRRLGPLGLSPALTTVGRVVAASAGGALVAWAVAAAVGAVLGDGRLGSLVVVLLGSVLGGGACGALLWAQKLPEVTQILSAGRRPAGDALTHVPVEH